MPDGLLLDGGCGMELLERFKRPGSGLAGNARRVQENVAALQLHLSGAWLY
jgi:hypothetical protein